MAILDTLNWIGESLDKPGAAARGLIGNTVDFAKRFSRDPLRIVRDPLDVIGEVPKVFSPLANLIPFSDTMGITDPRQRTSGRGLLEQWGMAKNRPGLDMGDVAGFGMEMATDPLNLLGLGMVGRTAMRAGDARAVNRVLSADNAGIGAANAISQRMRTAGALPEELLPQARKVTTGIDDARRADDMFPVPGEMLPGMPLDKLPPARLAYFDDVTRRLGIGEPPDMRVWPDLRTLDDDTLLDVRDRISELHKTLSGQPLRASATILSDTPYTQPINELDRLAMQLYGTGDMTDAGRLLSNVDDANANFYDIYRQLTRDISADQGSFFNRRSGIVEPGVRQSPPDGLSFEYGEGNDIFEEVLRDSNDPMHRAAKAFEELERIKGGLGREVQRIVQPAAEANQSFYALPNPKFIDPDLHDALTSENFPASQLSLLETVLGPMRGRPVKWQDAALAKMTPPFRDANTLEEALQGTRGLLGEESANRLAAQLAGGRDIPGPYADAYSGGQTFLPYIAPKLRDLLPMQEIPRQSRMLLASLLSQNTLAPMGRR